MRILFMIPLFLMISGFTPQNATETPASQKELVFFDHDGGIDDLLSQMLLLTMPGKEVIGIAVTPADCYIEPALESSHKILQLFERTDIPLGRGELNGVNAFPAEWRAEPEVVNAFPEMMNLSETPDPYNYPTATELYIQQLSAANRPVTIVITGPCSTLVNALEQAPEIKDKIKQVIWMGGAFEVPGNVQNYQHNGSAEWNVYWDPARSQKLVEAGLALVCVPLDASNQVPVSKNFLSRLAGQSGHALSELAAQYWATTIDTIPSYVYTYFMWDVLAMSYIAIPDAFTLKTAGVRVGLQPPNEGQTIIDEAGGNRIQYASAVNKDNFFGYLLEQLKTPIILDKQPEMMNTTLEDNKKNAVAFYRTAYEGNPQKAVELYVGDEYIQHNPAVKNGTEGFIEYFERMQDEYPEKSIEFIRVIAEGNLVALHTLQIWPGNEEYVTMDFFRFDGNGKIVEHWDSIQQIPENSANPNKMY